MAEIIASVDRRRCEAERNSGRITGKPEVIPLCPESRLLTFPVLLLLYRTPSHVTAADEVAEVGRVLRVEFGEIA